MVGIVGPVDNKLLRKGRDVHKYFTKHSVLYERNPVSEKGYAPAGRENGWQLKLCGYE